MKAPAARGPARKRRATRRSMTRRTRRRSRRGRKRSRGPGRWRRPTSPRRGATLQEAEMPTVAASTRSWRRGGARRPQHQRRPRATSSRRALLVATCVGKMLRRRASKAQNSGEPTMTGRAPRSQSGAKTRAEIVGVLPRAIAGAMGTTLRVAKKSKRGADVRQKVLRMSGGPPRTKRGWLSEEGSRRSCRRGAMRSGALKMPSARRSRRRSARS
mmetsp:Transcript_5833/g.14482  ORF Transcript_5833/g.14482 Transcript_5833/m.14482 type:complete len:215 (-) Transcript_5833:866-1510(-)